jgi:hypothetical protein
MVKRAEIQKREPKFQNKKQSERSKEPARQVGPDLSEVFDQIIGEMGRNVAFPPCPACGKAMGLVQVMPLADIGYEERLFKCAECGTMEAKILNKD